MDMLCSMSLLESSCLGGLEIGMSLIEVYSEPRGRKQDAHILNQILALKIEEPQKPISRKSSTRLYREV